MAEYITKKQVVEWFRPYGHTEEGIPFDELETDIAGMTTADVAQVVHGRWIRLGLGGNKRKNCSTIFECSACKRCVPHISDYCPNCGAKMDKEDNYETD